jgi:hypothetical protein
MSEALRLMPVAVRNALVRELVETTTYVGADGEPVEFDELPVVLDPAGDED